MISTILEITGAFTIIYTLLSWASKYDATDDKVNKKRSGLALYIDHETGVHYVGTGLSGVIPRLKSDGTLYVEERPVIKQKV